jgi:hypothetical protein
VAPPYLALHHAFQKRTEVAEAAVLLAILYAWYEAVLTSNATSIWRTSFEYELSGIGHVHMHYVEGLPQTGFTYQKVNALTTQADDLYPAALMDEYQALIERKFRRAHTPEDVARLQAVREEINAVDRQRSRPDTWDMQHQRIQEELAQIRAEAEALHKA